MPNKPAATKTPARKGTPRALSYARQSKTDKAHKGMSTGSQHRRNHESIARNGFTDLGEFTDEGISASRFNEDTERPDFNTLIKMARAKEMEYIAVIDLDRLTRDIDVVMDLKNLCRETGLKLLCGDRPVDPSTLDGLEYLYSHGVSAAIYSEKLSDTITGNLKDAAIAGRPHGRYTYGYDRIFDPTTKELLRVEINPDQAKVVLDMMTRLLAGDSQRQIAYDLNVAGVPTPQKTTGRWRCGNIKELVLNPAYFGVRMHYDTEYPAIWEPIISRADHEELKRKLSHPDLHRPGSAGAGAGSWRHLLTPVMTCSECGHKVCHQQARQITKPVEGGTKEYTVQARYACVEKGCGKVSVMVQVADKKVVDVIIGRVEQPDFVEELTRADDADEKTRLALEKVDSIKAQIEELKAKHDANLIDLDLFLEFYATRKAQLLAAEAEVPAPPHDPALIALAGPGARERWDKMSLSAQVQLIKLLVTVKLTPGDGTRSRKATRTKRIVVEWKH